MNIPTEDDSNAEEMGEIFEELSGSLQRIAWTLLRDWQLAADAVQETFLVLGKKWQEVKPDRRKAWLVKTVQYQAHNLRRKQKRSQPVADVTSIVDSNRPSEVIVEVTDQVRQIREQIQQLPPEQQTVLRMRLDEEKSFSQIANELEIPLGTVLSRTRLALEKLRNQKND
ncbi:MAG: RNA polymerase sigma factor [Planctomycetota bacterium]